MIPFERHLQKIANKITIKDEDRLIYTKDYDIIRDYILNIMRRESSVFKRFFKGSSLFGSYANNVRINYPDEFDVIFELSVPFSSYIDIEPDRNQPGYIRLNFSDVMEQFECAQGFNIDDYNLINDITDWQNGYLRRSNLQRWLQKLIEDGLNDFGYTVRGTYGDSYTLIYSKRGLAHTIFAQCQAREISIDFVPALVFRKQDWIKIRPNRPFTYKCNKWYALPKPASGPKKSRKYAFQICNPIAEHDLLLNNQNLKVVFRLLKSLRNKYGMPRLKSYFFTTAFLWELEKQSKEFFNNSLGTILVHMLDVLSDYFLEGSIPFFWDKDRNLLEIFNACEIEDYADKLCNAYNTLQSYKNQPLLSYSRCESHFKIPGV